LKLRKNQLMRVFSYNFYNNKVIGLITPGMLDGRTLELLVSTVIIKDLIPVFVMLVNSRSENSYILLMRVVKKYNLKNLELKQLIDRITVLSLHKVNMSTELLELLMEYYSNEEIPEMNMLINMIKKMKKEDVTGSLLSQIVNRNRDVAV